MHIVSVALVALCSTRFQRLSLTCTYPFFSASRYIHYMCSALIAFFSFTCAMSSHSRVPCHDDQRSSLMLHPSICFSTCDTCNVSSLMICAAHVANMPSHAGGQHASMIQSHIIQRCRIGTLPFTPLSAICATSEVF